MSDCIFCKIAAKQIPAQIVYEDERAVAFRDLNPQAPTHVLVIPRAHVASIDDVKAEHEADLGHLYSVAALIAEKEGLSSGYRAVVNNGAHAGQSVSHLHLHVLGGRPMGWPPFPR